MVFIDIIMFVYILCKIVWIIEFASTIVPNYFIFLENPQKIESAQKVNIDLSYYRMLYVESLPLHFI